jgi:hypothetical protein
MCCLHFKVKEYIIQATASRKPFSPRQIKYVAAKRQGSTTSDKIADVGHDRPPRSPQVKLLTLLFEGQYQNTNTHIKLVVSCGKHMDNKFNGTLRP